MPNYSKENIPKSTKSLHPQVFHRGKEGLSSVIQRSCKLHLHFLFLKRRQLFWEEREGQKYCLSTQTIFLRKEQLLTLFLRKLPSISVGEQAGLSRTSPCGGLKGEQGERSRDACSGAGTRSICLWQRHFKLIWLLQVWSQQCCVTAFGVRFSFILNFVLLSRSNSKWLAGIL